MELRFVGTQRICKNISDALLKSICEMVSESGCDYSLTKDKPEEGLVTLQIYDFKAGEVTEFVYGITKELEPEINVLQREYIDSIIIGATKKRVLKDFWEEVDSKSVINTDDINTKLYCIKVLIDYMTICNDALEVRIDNIKNELFDLLDKYSTLK